MANQRIKLITKLTIRTKTKEQGNQKIILKVILKLIILRTGMMCGAVVTTEEKVFETMKTARQYRGVR